MLSSQGEFSSNYTKKTTKSNSRCCKSIILFTTKLMNVKISNHVKINLPKEATCSKSALWINETNGRLRSNVVRQTRSMSRLRDFKNQSLQEYLLLKTQTV